MTHQAGCCLPLDAKRGSNDVCSGSRSCYEGLEAEADGHAFAMSPYVCMMHKQMLLREKRDLQLYLDALDAGAQQDCIEVAPVSEKVDLSVCLVSLPILTPECAKKFYVPMTSPNSAGLCSKGYAWDMVFVANMFVALMVVGVVLGSMSIATESALVEYMETKMLHFKITLVPPNILRMASASSRSVSPVLLMRRSMRLQASLLRRGMWAL